jgi:hypothetical protein
MQLLESTMETKSEVLISAERISRNGEQSLGTFRLDERNTELLGRSMIGLFADRFVSVRKMLERVFQLANCPGDKKWIVAFHSHEIGVDIYQYLMSQGMCRKRRNLPVSWTFGNVVFTSVEGLAKLDCESWRDQIGALILLDPGCIVYKARTLKVGNFRVHDRPQIIANFLCDATVDDVQPVFMLMTSQAASSLPTETIARAYMREAWWFLDGSSVKIV